MKALIVEKPAYKVRSIVPKVIQHLMTPMQKMIIDQLKRDSNIRLVSWTDGILEIDGRHFNPKKMGFSGFIGKRGKCTWVNKPNRDV